MPLHLESIDSGSNYNFSDKTLYANPPRSAFDLSHLCTLTIPNAGIVVPLGMPIETVPGDDFDISVDALVRVMPQVVPLYSRQRLYVYAFWSPYESLMCDWNVFARRGYSGNELFKLPSLIQVLDFSEKDPTGVRRIVLPDSWLDYIGIPVGSYLPTPTNGATGLAESLTKPLLWAMQSVRIKRDYFVNRDYFIDNRLIFPDDDSRFRLNRDGELLSLIDLRPELKGFHCFNITCNYNDPEHIVWSSSNYDDWLAGVGDPHYFCSALFHHDYPSDYFLSAKPWPQRGEAPTLQGNVMQLPVGYTDTLGGFHPLMVNGFHTIDFSGSGGTTNSPSISGYNIVTSRNQQGIGSDTSGISITSVSNSSLNNTPESNVTPMVTPFSAVSLGISLNNIRELAIAQTELERMARTDGSYTGFALTFFGERPRLDVDYRPVYIGGTYKNLVFNEVLQTSGSSIGTTDPESTSPLGAYSGHGIGGMQDGYIGHIHCDDYGSIMILACIMPDVYYHQGIPKEMTMQSQSELYLPDRARLGMVPIYNRELYWQNDDSSQPDKMKNNYLWAYQDPFDEMRYRPNTVHGKIADATNRSFFPYTQARHFSTLPTYGDAFAESIDVRKDYLYARDEDAYSAQFKLNIRAVRPLPYKAIPAEILN